MGIGVSTKELRKVYTSPPPLAGPAARGRMMGRKEKKKFEVIALDGVSLEIEPGEIFGLLGPNGAGKSTTIGILTTRVRPTSGDARIGHFDVWRQQVEAKRLIGVVQQRPNLDFALTAASELLEKFQLTERSNDVARKFSGGMMQRLSIARAMMHDPQVMFLDEPSTGLDPQTRLLLWEIVRDYNRHGKTILLTTHNMEEADALCHRIAIIDHGRVIAIGTPAELKASIPGGYLLRLHVSRKSPELVARLAEMPGVTEARQNGDSIDLYADRGGPLIGPVAAAVAESGTELVDVHISEPSLENLFLHHTGRSLRQ
jgi:ABC-2 type transport system ATP-binding protein